MKNRLDIAIDRYIIYLLMTYNIYNYDDEILNSCKCLHPFPQMFQPCSWSREPNAWSHKAQVSVSRAPSIPSRWQKPDLTFELKCSGMYVTHVMYCISQSIWITDVFQHDFDILMIIRWIISSYYHIIKNKVPCIDLFSCSISTPKNILSWEKSK